MSMDYSKTNTLFQCYQCLRDFRNKHKFDTQKQQDLQLVMLRLLHRLGVIRVPTEYRESEAW